MKLYNVVMSSSLKVEFEMLGNSKEDVKEKAIKSIKKELDDFGYEVEDIKFDINEIIET